MIASPTIVLRNNLPFAVELSIMNNTLQQPSVINASHQFLYNMDCEGFSGTNRISVLSRLVGALVDTTYTAVIVGTPSVTTAVTALNTLGIGLFYTYTTNGVPYITVFSDTRTYGAIDLFDSLNRDVDCKFAMTTTENTSGGFSVDRDCVRTDDFLAPSNVIDTQADVPFGTQYKLVLTGGNNLNPDKYLKYAFVRPDGTFLSGTLTPGEVRNFDFVVDIPAGTFYRFTMTDSE